MNPVVLSFELSLAAAMQRLEDAHTQDALRNQWNLDRGVLHGYFLAGAVCEVEYQAARRELQRVYESRLGLFDLQAEWRRRHPSETE